MNQSSRRLRVCVVGAGLSGLATIKELQAAGHQVTCFEQASAVGGVFADKNTYDSVRLTVSNYFMAYSDFMPVHERLKFWTKSEYLKYLGDYVEHFQLGNCIRFGTSVLVIERNGEHWTVQTLADGQGEQTHRFDAVAVCAGQFQKVKTPEFKGREVFQGRVIHSTDYRSAEEFTGMRVLCVGLGESSADITTEIAQVADQTLLSLRRYPLVAQRHFAVLDRSSYNVRYPLDVFTSSRTYNTLPRDIHTQVTRKTFRQFMNSYDPATRLRGKWNFDAGPESQQVIMKNERIFDAIVDGQVAVNVSGIERLTSHGVVFNDGEEEAIDVVVCCTGFCFSVPFLNLGITDPRELYKNMFHPEFGDSLALIGFVRPQQGGVPALAELQARYFALICSGDKALPRELPPLIEQDQQRWLREFALTPHVTALVNYAHFAEDLAQCIGCEVEVDRRREPELHQKCHEGPLWAIQYRLRGPGATPDVARKILLQHCPVPYKSSRVARFFYRSMLWLRRTLPFGAEARPRLA